ncbi:MAG: PorP/SprF family type IX secretion system membrane protein [Bacteroidales bacterium]|nr:PorP/SprF family type IX secretion system membrane protein [Bacteroidales bacterium]
MRKYLYLLMILIGFERIEAQDFHFSFFNTTALNLNPANTGAFAGDQRGLLVYRNQWKSVTEPYVTYLASFDMGIAKKTSQTGFLAVGSTLLSDKTGSSEFKTLKATLSIAYHVILSMKSILSAGLNGAYVQQSFDQSGLFWHNQFTGNGFDASIPSGENITSEKRQMGDVSAGLLYSYVSNETSIASNDGVKLNVGVAYHHINRPKIDFTGEEFKRLYSKFLFHFRGQIGLFYTNTALIPEVLTAFQGPARMITFGMGGRFMLKEQSRYTGFVKESALTLGGYFRVGDAINPYLTFEVGSFAFGLVYDINISGLAKASNGRGAFEILLQYVNPNPFKYRRNAANNSFF